MARTFVVIRPVVDLRSSPGIILPDDYSHQEGRETQLLLGESLELIEEKSEWLNVGALEQLRYTDQAGWSPYPGWVHRSEVQEGPPTQYSHVVCTAKYHSGSTPDSNPDCTPSSLSYGTWVNSTQEIGTRAIPNFPNREQMVLEARPFIGMPYLWGGRSLGPSSQVASVDCSGLVNLLYRAQGIHIPRNAHDQYLISRSAVVLQPGDLLYLAKNVRVNHVIMKLDEFTFIEAPETGKNVRLLKWGIDVWEEEGKIRIFDRPHSYTAYPRSFIHTH